MESWAKKLRAKMIINDITSSELAERLDVTKSYVSMVFHGRENPKDAKTRFTKAVDDLIAERSKA